MNGSIRPISLSLLLIALLGISCQEKKPPPPPAEPTGGTAGCDLFFNNWNTAGVLNGAVNPSFTLTAQDPSELCAVATYHAAGKVPGRISLHNKTTGVTYGPWDATGTPGQGGVANANWEVLLNPRIELKPGEYEVIDSHPPSWSWNNTSLDKDRPPKAAGFAKVWLANTQ